ncbi:helix-turn-helix domain-containing protein [Streptomyces sp. NPDC007863]|uniref:helix-turn-helix domain-containing protein n=1 Tax=Streptomyces sp. NPDC007863 TaxID=3154894 RepID=UPI0033D478BE
MDHPTDHPASDAFATGARARLGAVLAAIPDGLAAVVLTGAGQDAEVTDVAVIGPGEELGPAPGALVLAAGARGATAVAAVEDAGRAGATAVVLKAGPAGLPEGLADAARAAGVSVLATDERARWDRLAEEARAVLAAPSARRGVPAGTPGDLFSLAQTLATVTHGAAIIEDTAGHVLAYSRSGDEADELRRLTILGRSCPEPYLRLLRERGTFTRLRAGEDVVEIEEQPEHGYRRRLAVGVIAGPRPLGTIWLQEGRRPLDARSDEALRGAARLAAPQLIDHHYQGDASARVASRAELAHGLLTGRFDAVALAGHLGLDPGQGATVVAVDLREPEHPGTSAAVDLRRGEAAGIVSVHAAAFRRDALVAQACGQIYVMLPAKETGGDPAAADAELHRWAAALVTSLRRHTGTPVQAALAGTAPRLDAVPAAKKRGHRTLRLMARTPDRPVATHAELHASLVLDEVLRLLDAHPDTRHAGLAILVDHDTEHRSELARSLLAYLDGFGDVTRTAEALNVHPNTLRYRVRKAVALSGIGLDDPDQRLVAMLQLRLAVHGDPSGNTPFPTP